MTELTMAARGVRALLDLAVSKGASRETLLVRAMIAPADLEDCDNRIGFGKYVALMRAAQELCRDPALALHFGEAVDVTEISIACSVGGADSIDGVFAQVNRYASLGVEVAGAENGDRYRLKRCDGQLWIVDERRNPNDFPELTESSFTRMVCSTRRTFPEANFFKEIRFTHPEPPYRSEYDRILRVPLVFGSAENAIRIDEVLVASARLPWSSPYISSVLKDRAEHLLEKLQRTRSTKAKVESVLAAMLKEGRGTAEAVACELGLSRQTLFRRLKAEGATFEEVLADLRCSLARDYLSDQKKSVKETAYLLGFSDPTAFSRAYKRWTGEPPAASRTKRSVGFT